MEKKEMKGKENIRRVKRKEEERGGGGKGEEEERGRRGGKGEEGRYLSFDPHGHLLCVVLQLLD